MKIDRFRKSAVKSSATMPPGRLPAPHRDQAIGRLRVTFGRAKAELKFATEFVDQKDDSKPVVLVISDQKLPVEKWVSEFEMMLDENKTKLDAAFHAALK
jgi:hypothetical protein